jgi:hypothetical protein
MKIKRIGLLALLLFVLGLAEMRAQQATPAAGGTASSAGRSVSFTLGQVFYFTRKGPGSSVSQGVQQSYDISTVFEIPEAMGITLFYPPDLSPGDEVITDNIDAQGDNQLMLVYPNPTAEYVKLKVEGYPTADLEYRLYDSAGKGLRAGKLEGAETYIDMSNQINAAYFLKVVHKRHNSFPNELKTFKIVKN